RTLRTVAAILRAAAGLDAEKARGLYAIGIEMPAMHGLRAKHQIGKRQRVECFGRGAGPVIAVGLDDSAFHDWSINQDIPPCFVASEDICGMIYSLCPEPKQLAAALCHDHIARVPFIGRDWAQEERAPNRAIST